MRTNKVDPSVYDRPDVITAMATVDERALQDEAVVWAVFYNPDTKAIFTGPIDRYPEGCVDIYDTEEGKLY